MKDNLWYIEVSSTEDKNHLIQLKGTVTISTIRNIARELQKMIKERKYFVLQLTDIENIDVSGLQLLESLKKEYREQVDIQVQLTSELHELLHKSGFTKYIVN